MATRPMRPGPPRSTGHLRTDIVSRRSIIALVPNVSVEDQAKDVAAAIRYLRGRAAELGFDPGNIVLMGHSAGAHLAALVGTDDRYLGKDLESVGRVVLLDGAGYDLPRQLEQAGRFEAKIYEQPFGALNPVTLESLSRSCTPTSPTPRRS